MPGQGRIGDLSQVPIDIHGCVACPHTAIGPAVLGSADVLVNNMSALRVDDLGIHAACCGPNMWKAITGSTTVLINGKPAHRLNDLDLHCGGLGKLITASPNVITGG